MINYYEILKLDINASLNDIQESIQLLENNTVNAEQIRQIKSILLNPNLKEKYDQKLMEHLLTSATNQSADTNFGLKHIYKFINDFELNDKTIHNNYIYIVLLASAFYFFLLSFSSHIIAIIWLGLIVFIHIFFLTKDWEMLKKFSKNNFPKSYIYLPPIYLQKRARCLSEKKTFFKGWVAMATISLIIHFYYWAPTAILESNACEVVTDIIQNQLYRKHLNCESVTLNSNEGKKHSGVAEMSDGRVINISVQEINDGKIYVQADFSSYSW